MPVLETSELRMRVALPALSAIAANPIKVIVTFFVLAVASAIFIPDELGWLSLTRMVTVAVGVSVVGVAAVGTRLANRLPRRPTMPKRQMARLEWIGAEPPLEVQVAQYRCQMCGRPLTNPESQLAGVGPDCRSIYGARPEFIRNPAHEEWQRRQQQELVRQQRQQALFDQQHHAALLDHDRLIREWEVQLQSPLNQARAQVVRTSTRTLTVDLGLLVSYILSELVAFGVNAAGLSLW